MLSLDPHPLRETLHQEVHARPYERLVAPLLLTHLAFVGANAQAARQHVERVLAAEGAGPMAPGGNYLSVDLHGTRLRFEAHTEFYTLSFSRPVTAPLGSTWPVLALPEAWLEDAPGQWLVGLHVLVLPNTDASPVAPANGDDASASASTAAVRAWMAEDSLIGSRVMDASAEIYTDFRLHDDGFGRWAVMVNTMNPRRLGRAVQRLLEIETYRMAALLGLPTAREVGARLTAAERDLAQLAGQIREAPPEREPELLASLSDLAAQVESMYASTHARFSASAAYFELLQHRVSELREERLPSLQTLHEFLDRRLTPAMQTCVWVSRRQQALSERVARASNLLRTRVDIAQQLSSRALLDAMNRRGRAQLLLQSAVEGLSVAAIAYYGAGLVGYGAKGLAAAGVPVDPDIAVAVAIPIIALVVWVGVRRLHRRVLEHA